MASKPFATNHDLASADVNDLVGVYRRLGNEIDVTATTTETDVLKNSGGTALSIGAGHMSSDRMLRATIKGDYLNNTGATLQVRVKFGGVTQIDSTTIAIPASANRRPFRIVVEIENRGATNSQLVTLLAVIGYSAPSATGIGTLGILATDALNNQIVGGTGTIDTTAARNLEVTVQHQTNSASLSFRKRSAIVELL